MTYKKEFKKTSYKKADTTKVTYKPKRGPLSKLMTEEEKQKAGIHELSYDFGCRITRLYQWLTEDAEYKEYVQSKQIYRSGTSIGANVRESKHAQSDADFLSKMSIAYKEADERESWKGMMRMHYLFFAFNKNDVCLQFTFLFRGVGEKVMKNTRAICLTRRAVLRRKRPNLLLEKKFTMASR